MKLGVRPIYTAIILWIILIQISFSMPKIPQSERVITFQEVKNFWINKIVHSSFPRQPSGLYPKEQAAWRNALQERHELLRDIRSGVYDEEARITQLRHNSNAWRLKANDEEANKLDEELRKINLYRAELEKLELQWQAFQLQKQAVEVQAELAQKIDGIRGQIELWSRCCP